MVEQVQLQEMLGVDKKNPFFTLCTNPEQPGKLLVYFGMSLLEVVDDAPNSPSFKLLLARLYNAGVKPQSLLETFKISYTSLRRWGEALKSDDSEKLIRVLAGHQHPRKLTPEILSFSQARFYAIYPDNHYSYSKVIRQEILETFDKSISGESLRPYFAQWMAHLTVKANVLESAQPEASTNPITNSHSDSADTSSPSNENTVVQPGQNPPPLATTADEENNLEPGHKDSEVLLCGDLALNNRKQAVVLVTDEPTAQVIMQPHEGYQFCHPAGILLFSAFFNELRSAITTGQQLITQWLTAILLGAVNIEQTKLLNYPSLDYFLGQTQANRHQQRQGLTQIAHTSCADELLQLNGKWVGIAQCTDFYYGPHSKHDTGANTLLKGWCARLRFAEKVLHMDFIHMPTGVPVYRSHDDNYLDLRERFFDVVSHFRSLFSFPDAQALTFILDRGIYGIDTFKKCLSDKPQNHFITWEKGFRVDKHKDVEWMGSMSLYRAKNSSQDLKRYHFSYCDRPWPRHDKIRQIIVKATNPKGRSITVSILCSDLERCVQGIIMLMFDRWIQENDFKYLEVHFGINEITHYATFTYKEIEKTLQDRAEKSGLYKALEKQRITIKNQLKTQLLNEHSAKNKSKDRQKKIAVLTQELTALEEKISGTQKEVSRLERLAEEGFQKLDTGKKLVMDSIKVWARNLFYACLTPFKKAYDNYRDDHVLFRHLTRSSGLIRDTGECIEVILTPQACFPPKVIGIFNSMLETFNRTQVEFPDGGGRKITLHLLENNKRLFEASPQVAPVSEKGKDRGSLECQTDLDLIE